MLVAFIKILGRCHVRSEVIRGCAAKQDKEDLLEVEHAEDER